MKFSSTAAVALMAAAASTVQGHDLLKNIFSLDCDGSVYSLNNFPFGFGFKVKGPWDTVNTYIKNIKERAQCACPGFTEADFNLMFDPVTAILNNVNEHGVAPSQCLSDNFPRSLHGLYHFAIMDNLPNSCNYQNWIDDGYCGLSYNLPDADISLQVQIKDCPNSYLPSISVSCGGEDCENGFSLCRNNNDCGADVDCVDLLDLVVPGEFGDHDDVANRFFEIYSGWIYDEDNEASPGCFQEKRGTVANPTKDNDILARLTFLMYKHFFGWDTTSFRPQVCDSEIFNKFIESIQDDNSTSGDNGFEFGGFGPDAIDISEVDMPAPCIYDGENGPANVTRVSLTFLGPLSEISDYHIANPTFATPSANRFPLIQATCDMQFRILDRVSLRVSNKMISLINDFFRFQYDLSSCRYNPDLTLDQFISRFDIPNPLFLLGVFDDTASFNRGKDLPAHYTVRDALFLFDDMEVKLTELPCEMTQAHYIEHGKVTAKWTGLSTLFGLDVTIEVTVSKCSGSDVWNSYFLDCVGKDCERFLSGLTPCTSDSQCGGEGLVCSYLADFIETVEDITYGDYDYTKKRDYGGSYDYIPGSYGYIPGFPGSSGYDEDTISGELIKLLFSAECDFTEALHGPSAGDFCEDIDIDVENKTSACFSESTCFGPSKYAKDLHRLLMAAFGKPGAALPSNPNNYLKFCVVDVEALLDRDFDAWANTLITVDEAASTIKINHIGEACGEDESSGDASSLKAFSIFTLLLFSIVAMFF